MTECCDLVKGLKRGGHRRGLEIMSGEIRNEQAALVVLLHDLFCPEPPDLEGPIASLKPAKVAADGAIYIGSGKRGD